MKIILGTMTFGGQTTEEDASTMLKEFVEGTAKAAASSVKKKMASSKDDADDDDDEASPPTPTVVDVEVDTAIMYQNGQTEHILGRIVPQLTASRKIDPDVDADVAGGGGTTKPNILIASKANPFTKDKNLSPAGLRQQLESSLQALADVDVEGHDAGSAVDLYYLHAPDVKHDIEPTLDEVQRLYEEGKFRRFGLSNFTAWETVYVHNYMSRRSYVVPTVYQGMYNALARRVETELFPALRKLNMSFYAYNPLAAGMLTGKYSKHGTSPNGQEETRVGTTTTRFAGKSFWAKRYRERYQQDEQFDAVETLRRAIEDYNSKNKERRRRRRQQQLSMTDASLRWLKYHSCLDASEGDGIILGASSLQHFRTNWKSLAFDGGGGGGGDDDSEGSDEEEMKDDSQSLPPEILKAFDDAWMKCKGVCPDYSRGYSGSLHPATANLQGKGANSRN